MIDFSNILKVKITNLDEIAHPELAFERIDKKHTRKSLYENKVFMSMYLLHSVVEIYYFDLYDEDADDDSTPVTKRRERYFRSEEELNYYIEENENIYLVSQAWDWYALAVPQKDEKDSPLWRYI